MILSLSLEMLVDRHMVQDVCQHAQQHKFGQATELLQSVQVCRERAPCRRTMPPHHTAKPTRAPDAPHTHVPSPRVPNPRPDTLGAGAGAQAAREVCRRTRQAQRAARGEAATATTETWRLNSNGTAYRQGV